MKIILKFGHFFYNYVKVLYKNEALKSQSP